MVWVPENAYKVFSYGTLYEGMETKYQPLS